MWKRLLVPHDFSECAARALRVAVDLSRIHGASIAILHVSDLPANLAREALVTPPGEKEAVRVDDYTTRGARRQLELIAEPLRKEGVVVQTHAVVGDVAEQILEVAAELRTDAIVAGTHGRKGLSHLLLGSVAEKIVRHASVPVVTVRSSAPEAEPTREESAAEDELSG